MQIPANYRTLTLESSATRERCFEYARAKCPEFEDAPNDAVIVISEQGNYTIGSDVLMTLDDFELKYSQDRSKRTSFLLEDVRHP